MFFGRNLGFHQTFLSGQTFIILARCPAILFRFTSNPFWRELLREKFWFCHFYREHCTITLEQQQHQNYGGEEGTQIHSRPRPRPGRRRRGGGGAKGMLCYAMVPAYNTKHGADGEREGEGESIRTRQSS